jgi:septal ring factor EnvC (AmiA/AmiB activator)
LQRELEESRVQTTSLMGHNKSLDQTVKTLEHKARELNVVKSNSEEELSAIQMELEYIRSQSEEVVNNWKGMYESSI